VSIVGHRRLSSYELLLKVRLNYPSLGKSGGRPPPATTRMTVAYITARNPFQAVYSLSFCCTARAGLHGRQGLAAAHLLGTDYMR
jgi:hypothetical protein